MNRNITYKQLEDKLVKYRDLKNIPVKENGEIFVSLPKDGRKSFGVIGKYQSLEDMKEKFPLVPVRQGVSKRLDLIDKALKEIDSNLQLVVAYGFRSLEIQQQYFELQKKKYLESGVIEDENVDEVVHRLIAVPTVAGHPTGGAVDVYIVDKRNGKMLDFGVPIFTFDSKDVYTFSPFIGEEAPKNRDLLRKVMMLQNFAPYDGEWWHFSFGDKEWAFYYQQPFAFYEQKTEQAVTNSLEADRLCADCIVLRPGGNDTALITRIEDDPQKRKQINDRFMLKYPSVEQVGFVNLDLDNAELMMAGGEFCGNATRSTAWLILKGQLGEILIKVSGVESKLRAGVDQEGNAWAQMPIYPDPSKITFLDDGRAVVAMEGITHVVMDDIYQDASPEELKQIALGTLKELGLDRFVAAAGVMFIAPSKTGVDLRPVVFVRDINTLFYETACGSGTTAVGLLEALKRGRSVNLSVTQPSGMPINIRVTFDGSKFEQAVISGPIQLVSKENR